MGRTRGPGPNVYQLPTTVGFTSHDATKLRNPCYTIGHKFLPDKGGLGPGLYDLDSSTRFGPAKGPAFTFRIQHKDLSKVRSPGPIVYSPPALKKENPPKFSMGLRTEEKLFKNTPGPNVYKLPALIGPNIPNKPTIGAYTIGQKSREIKSEGVPAPNHYDRPSLNAFKQKMPKYTISSRVWPPDPKKPYPAANNYLVRPPKKPGFSFGLRPSSAKYTYFTMDDINTPVKCGKSFY